MSGLMAPLLSVRAGVLDVSYFATGPAEGPAVLLMHGFPYDIHAYVEVAPMLAAAGCRVIVPYLRGFGVSNQPIQVSQWSATSSCVAAVQQCGCSSASANVPAHPSGTHTGRAR